MKKFQPYIIALLPWFFLAVLVFGALYWLFNSTKEALRPPTKKEIDKIPVGELPSAWQIAKSWIASFFPSGTKGYDPFAKSVKKKQSWGL